MYPIPPNEHLVETKVCKHCRASFPITDKDMEFYEKVSPVFSGKKYTIPTPTLCPDCRQQRRLTFRNERKLYKRKCDATGKDIVSIYSPDKPFKVYHQDYWWGDAWNPMSYGREFDFTRGFFEQFRELLREVPRPALFQRGSENSEYTQTSTNNKNGFMLFESSFNEDCSYSYWLHHSADCVDCSFCDLCNLCFDCIDSSDCHSLIGCQNCIGCKESFFLKNCIGCQHCFGSINLANAKYNFFDTQLSQNEYEKKVSLFLNLMSSYKGRKNKCIEFHSTHIQRFAQIWKSEASTGDYIRNGKNCHHCFYVFAGAEHIRYTCNTGMLAEYVMDGDAIGANASYIFESINTALNSHRTIFSIRSWGSQDDFYLNECDNCIDCFGCICLRNKQYCILNKQYTKEEYEILVPRIIEHMMKTGEWGEFFPSSLSPFGYNETVAMEYFPMTRDSVIARNETIQETTEALDSHASLHFIRNDGSKNSLLHGPIFNWSDYEAPFPKVDKIIPANKLPDDISKIPDDILNWAIECEVTKKPFRIIKQELEFYRKHNLPIPRRHPDQRHLDRMALRNPRKLYERKCDKCGKDMITTYAPCEVKPSLEAPLGCAPERKEVVYCEECYNKEIIG